MKYKNIKNKERQNMLVFVPLTIWDDNFGKKKFSYLF